MADPVFSRPFFRFYGLLWRMASPLLKRSHRLADGWKERHVPDDWLAPDFVQADTEGHTADIWLQAASGGEARLAVSICRALRKDVPLRVLVATWTRQGRDVIEKALPSLKESHSLLHVAVRFAPFDRPDIARRAIDLARPRTVALLETELWPSLMAACREQDIPVQVINGRITSSTVRFGRFFSSLMRALSPVSVRAISEGDRQGFASIFPCPAQTMSNIKFDLAAELLNSPLASSEQKFRSEGPVFLFASVRSGEEGLLPEHLPRIFEERPDACLVIVPRHLHRVEAWRSALSQKGLEARLVSTMGNDIALSKGSVLIWDRFGDLPGLYAAAQAVFVGGSFSQGGQNFLESLAGGRVPCIGPSASNFLWALQAEKDLPTLEQAGLLHILPDPQSVVSTMLKQAREPQPRESVRDSFRAWLTPRLGGSAEAAALLEKHVTHIPGNHPSETL